MSPFFSFISSPLLLHVINRAAEVISALPFRISLHRLSFPFPPLALFLFFFPIPSSKCSQDFYIQPLLLTPSSFLTCLQVLEGRIFDSEQMLTLIIPQDKKNLYSMSHVWTHLLVQNEWFDVSKLTNGTIWKAPFGTAYHFKLKKYIFTRRSMTYHFSNPAFHFQLFQFLRNDEFCQLHRIALRLPLLPFRAQEALITTHQHTRNSAGYNTTERN